MAGWEELDAAPLDVRDADQKRKDMDRLVLRVFGDEDGERLIIWLKAMYVDIPVAMPGTDPSFAFFAEGQRNVIRDLLQRIKRAKEM